MEVGRLQSKLEPSARPALRLPPRSILDHPPPRPSPPQAGGRERVAADKRFNPNQPRMPAGNSDGGRWTATGGSGGAQIHRVSRTPSRPPGGGRSGAPQTVPVRIAGRTEMVSPTTYSQRQSSATLAQNMTNLARRFDRNWRPEPSMVGNVAGQIAANQSTTAQALLYPADQPQRPATGIDDVDHCAAGKSGWFRGAEGGA
jgi:hypothetical protein